MAADFSTQYPKLAEITRVINDFLATEYPWYFGTSPVHPHLELRRSKVIHDNLWGTNGFSWAELALIDSPIFQRLRNIHQTGLAYFVYPCARHTRFEHSLGVCTMASRVFDALDREHQAKLRKIAKEIYPNEDLDLAKVLANWRADLRIAALLHDTGHSIHSHTSEIVYSKIPMLSEAAQELTRFVGTKKGEGEVLSFCISRTKVIRDLLGRASEKVKQQDETEGDIDLDNASLLVVGRSKFPQLQFLGDIISSDLDADKLDYLLRDAISAGLPLRYDLERYLYTVNITEQKLGDGDGLLQNFYQAIGTQPERHAATTESKYPYYRTYKLQLPRQAINTIEQIIICKFMLFSYIYHHKKVRAAEGMLARLIERRVAAWRNNNVDDAQLISEFLRLTDCALDGETFRLPDADIAEYRERVVYRLLPRQVVGFTTNVNHEESAKLKRFMLALLDPDKKKKTALINDYETALATELQRLKPEFGQTKNEVLTKAGVWLDVPKPPNFNKLEELLVGADKLTDVFPITSWIQAYISYRYFVRVFAFSEYVEEAEKAVTFACKKVMGIDDPNFVSSIRRSGARADELNKVKATASGAEINPNSKTGKPDHQAENLASAGVRLNSPSASSQAEPTLWQKIRRFLRLSK